MDSRKYHKGKLSCVEQTLVHKEQKISGGKKIFTEFL